MKRRTAELGRGWAADLDDEALWETLVGLRDALKFALNNNTRGGRLVPFSYLGAIPAAGLPELVTPTFIELVTHGTVPPHAPPQAGWLANTCPPAVGGIADELYRRVREALEV